MARGGGRGGCRGAAGLSAVAEGRAGAPIRSWEPLRQAHGEWLGVGRGGGARGRRRWDGHAGERRGGVFRRSLARLVEGDLDVPGVCA